VIPIVVGTVAAMLSVASFIPQAWKIVKTRETRSLATPMWILSTTAFAIWTVYGVLLRAWPIIVPNAICFVLAGFILVFKLLPRRAREAVADALDPSA
jgi:MtN3 and saliva related transmembrane protein